jgi:hypothetical protein
MKEQIRYGRKEQKQKTQIVYDGKNVYESRKLGILNKKEVKSAKVA